MVTIKDFQAQQPTWCPSCGDFGVWMGIKKALVKLNIDPSEVCFVYGIGCHGHMVNFTRANGFEGLHGRALPVAAGIKMANKDLHVIAVVGDGDQLGEGLSHFLHACRANHNVTLVIHDNQTYGLTTGQTSPTSLKGYKTKSTPTGVIEEPVNPLMLGISAGASFVSRGFSQDMIFLSDLIADAIQHNGFSIVDVFQPCVTFNKVNTYEWFKKKVYKLEDHDQTDKMAAIGKAVETEKLPIGVFYKVEKPSYEDELPQIKDTALVKQATQKVDITKTMDKFC